MRRIDRIDMLKVRNLTLKEYRVIIKDKNHPLSFDAKWVDVSSKGKALYMSIEDDGIDVAIFVATIHRKAIITTPFCKYQGWILLKEDISESKRYEIAKATIESLPKHYYFNLNISCSFISIDMLKNLFQHTRSMKISTNVYQILNMDKINSEYDLKNTVSRDVRYIQKQAQSIGFDINYTACKEEVLKFAAITAKRKRYKTDITTIKSLMEINDDNITPFLISVSHNRLNTPSMGMFVVRHCDTDYCIACGYNTDVRKKLGLYQPNLFLFCMYHYLLKNIGSIKSFDFQGSSIEEIKRRNMKLSTSNNNYINIEYGYRYHPFRFL